MGVFEGVFQEGVRGAGRAWEEAQQRFTANCQLQPDFLRAVLKSLMML